MPQQSWFSIRNAVNGSDTAEIFIYDIIGGYDINAKSFIAELKKIGAANIDLRINSPGGAVFDGNAIYNALKRHPAAVTVFIDGIAASIASVVAMAGDVIRMPENAMMMIHNPSNLAFGDAEDMRRGAELLDKVKETIISAYASKTGRSRKQIAQLMDDETWMTAADALELGFADYIDDEVKAAACFELDPSVDTTHGGVKLKDLLAKLSGKPSPTPEPAPAPAAAAPPVVPTPLAVVPAPAAEPPTVESLTASITTLNTELGTVRAELGTKDARITELEGEIRDATQLATEMVAAMPIETPLPAGKQGEHVITDAAKTAEEVIADLNAITDPAARTEWVRKHKDVIDAANRELKARK